MSDEQDRIEAAAEGLSPTGTRAEIVQLQWQPYASKQAGLALAAADAWDRDHGYVRIKLDDAAIGQVIRRAIGDPGRFLPRGACGEAIPSWSARAVVAALREAAQ